MAKSKSNLSLRETLDLVINNVIDTNLKNKSGGTGTPISSVSDIQKKNDNGTVVKTDPTTYVTTVNVNGKLYNIEHNDYIIGLPIVGTGVEIGYDADGIPYIVSAKLCDTFSMAVVGKLDENAGTTMINADGTSISLTTGNPSSNSNLTEYGGMVIIAELTKKINALINEVNALKAYINTHSHPSAPTGPVTPPTAPFTGNFTTFNKGDYENTSITHQKYK